MRRERNSKCDLMPLETKLPVEMPSMQLRPGSVMQYAMWLIQCVSTAWSAPKMKERQMQEMIALQQQQMQNELEFRKEVLKTIALLDRQGQLTQWLSKELLDLIR